jgi:CheY-like chemotaxis protein
MTTKKVLARFKGKLTRDQLYSWERNGWVRPSKLERGEEMTGRMYSETEVAKIAEMIRLQEEQGLPIRMAAKLAQEVVKADNDAPRSILIVEDNPVHRTLLVDEFRSKFHVEWAGDEQKVMSYFNSGHVKDFDVVLLDLRLPTTEGSPGSSNECGFNILRKWDACDNPKPRVYVMSSYLVNSTREAVAKLRVSDILDKPFSPAGFRQRIEGELKRA